MKEEVAVYFDKSNLGIEAALEFAKKLGCSSSPAFFSFSF
jgi:hypothetical protein